MFKVKIGTLSVPTLNRHKEAIINLDINSIFAKK